MGSMGSRGQVPRPQPPLSIMKVMDEFPPYLPSSKQDPCGFLG